MSLQIWLPMTKDLIQQGLSDLTVANNGVTLSDSGKLGKCYYFDGNAHYLEFSKSLSDLYSGDFSYAVWLKPTDDTRSIICSEYSASGASNVAFELSAARGIRLYWNGSPDIYPSNCTLPKNEWSHVVITRSGNVAMFYINGVLKYTYTGTLANKTSTAKIRLGDDYRGGTSVSYMGYMNDFRIYDHALSAKEVEVLSRGLVAHYPLCDNSIQVSNVSNTSTTFNTSNADGGWSHWGQSGHKGSCGQTTSSTYIYTSGQTYAHRVTNASGATGNYLMFQSPSFSATGGYRSMSAIIKEVNGNKITDAICYPVWNGAADDKPYVWDIVSPLGNGFYLCKVESFQQDGTNNLVGIYVKPGKEIYVTNCYIENDRQACSDFIFGTSTAVYDCSGYQYNGTNNGSLTVSTDTARYRYCTYFSGDANYISLTSPTTAVRSVSFWIKFPTAISEYRVAFADYKSKLSFGFVNASRVCCTCSSNLKATFNITTPTVNTWYHVVVRRVSDSIDADIDLFINGVQQTSRGANDNWNHTTDTLMIGRRSTGASIVGYMSDFRAYSTILSNTQIAELYNTAVSVANNGTLLGYELVEV